MRTPRPIRFAPMLALALASAALGPRPAAAQPHLLGPDRVAGPAQLPDMQPAPGKPYRMMLISTRSNIGFDQLQMLGRGVTSGQRTVLGRYATPDCRVPWSVRPLVLRGGKQEGTQVVWLDNGRLKIGLIAGRGLGILSVLDGDVRMLGWDSPVQEVVNPQFVNLEARGGLGWLDGFNEWLCRGGMQSFGRPGPDPEAPGGDVEGPLTLHGRVANTPASEVEVIADREPPFRITVRGRVEERTFHGAKLVLESQLSTEPGSNSFRIHDSVTNVGGRAQEFQMLYHANFGPPGQEGARLLAPVEKVEPMDDRAALGITQYGEFQGPTPGFAEQVYGLHPRYEADHKTVALIHNKAGDRGASIRFRTDELPYLTVWKNTAAVEDGYVVGIEPGTSFPNHRRVEREAGRVPRLEPGASHQMVLDVGVHSDAAEIRHVAAVIARIQGDHKPTIELKPQKKN